MRCQRCGFECDGPRDITFVEAKIVGSRRSQKRAALAGTQNSAGDAGSSVYQIPLPLSLEGIEFNISVSYTRKHLRRGAPIDMALREIRLDDMTAASASREDCNLFHQALLSFALVLFGTQHGQPRISGQGYVLLGVALKRINEALQDPTCYTRDEVILAVITFAIMESYVPTGPDRYLMHVAGLERLLDLRRSGGETSPSSLDIYRRSQHFLLFASLRTGKPSILARDEWKAVLRINCSGDDVQEQDLLDVLADCTVLVARRDAMLATRDTRSERRLRQRDEIQEKALLLLDQLRSWKLRWDSDERNSYRESPVPPVAPEPMQGPSEDASLPPPTILEFSSESAAIMLMFYNTTLINVLRLLASLPSEPRSSPRSRTSAHSTANLDDNALEPPEDEYGAAERLAALEVCRCIPDYLRQKSGSDSGCSPFVHWAGTTAWKTLRGNESAEGRWVMSLLNKESWQVIAKGLWPNAK
ncbi:hypothetical protein GQ53DRAFT_746561 [Thozetella sp. PMI_491]|nr:hypothetical protein GQ53DRAFT_746561 [Thozetella sp. PMI_491]